MFYKKVKIFRILTLKVSANTVQKYFEDESHVLIENGILELLIEYYEKDWSRFADLVRAIESSMYEGEGPARVLNQLNRTYDPTTLQQESTGADKGKEKIDKQARNEFNKWVVILHAVFNVSLEVFNHETAMPIVKQLEKYKGHSDFIKVINLKGFDPELGPVNEYFRDEYVNELKSFLALVDTDLLIYDYLERQNLKLTEYMKAHDKLFKKIEIMLAEKAFTYQRFLTLPARIVDKNPLSLKGDDLKKKILEYCSLNLLKHIRKCIEQFADFTNPDKFTGFYMIANPFRVSHFALVDGGKAWLTETCRFDRNMEGKPDVLTIEHKRPGSPHQGVNDLYQIEFEKLHEKAELFTLNNVTELLDELIFEINLSIESSLSDHEQKRLNRQRVSLELKKKYFTTKSH